MVPVLPIFATELGLGATGIGALMAAPAVARLALNLPLGRLADTWGRKPLMQYGTLVTATGSIGTGLLMHSGLPAVLGARLLVGAGSASSMTGSQAMMADLTDSAPQHRATIMAAQGMILSGVWVAGPALGGYLAEFWGIQNSFFIAGVGIALCSFGYSRLPETLHAAMDRADRKRSSEGGAEKPPSEDTSFAARMRPLLADPNVQAISALSTSASVSQACFMAVLTLHARTLFEASAADLGLMFSLVGISYVAGGPVGGWLAGRFGRKALIVPGLLLSHAAFGSLAFAGTRESLYALVLLSNFSGACTSPALAAFTAEVLPPESRGQATSVARMCSDTASLSAPIALGLLADGTSCGTSILTTACIATSCTAFFAVRARELPGERKQS